MLTYEHFEFKMASKWILSLTLDLRIFGFSLILYPLFSLEKLESYDLFKGAGLNQNMHNVVTIEFVMSSGEIICVRGAIILGIESSF